MTRFVLVEDGNPKCRIVHGGKPKRVERHASFELQRYVRIMSGAHLPICERSSENEFNIFIGSAANINGADQDNLGYDGYIIKTTDNELILTGSAVHSCLYSVYHLLREYCGCGFFD